MAGVKNNQEKFKYYLGEIKKGSKKSKEQKNSLYNIEMLSIKQGMKLLNVMMIVH